MKTFTIGEGSCDNAEKLRVANQRIKELEQELNTVHKHIKLMFPHPQVTDGLFYVPIERYNNLVDELNKQAEDL